MSGNVAIDDAPQPFAFSLSGADRFRWMFAYRKRAQAGFFAFFIIPSFGLPVFIRAVRDPRMHAPALVLAAVLVLALAAWAARLASSMKRADHVSLAFSAKGIDFTRNGASGHIAWYAVKGAIAFERFIAIERRDDVKPILIPRSAMGHGDALWSYLERRLQGPPPPHRHFPPPARLVNRVDQFLADRAAV